MRLAAGRRTACAFSRSNYTLLEATSWQPEARLLVGDGQLP
jgi:hypothetical protein